MKGKPYANRKKKSERPESDLYHTPKSLVWELLKVERFQPFILEPAAGENSIVKVLNNHDYIVEATDIKTGQDFFNVSEISNNCDIITNPPFSLWDKFVFHGKKLYTDKMVMLGKLDYFACYGRSISGIWDELKAVYVFNRKVDYQTPLRNDGLFFVGMLNTGWFIWEKGYTGKPYIEILDVQKYAKLGSFDNFMKKNH